MQEIKFTFHKQYFFGRLFSRNVKKTHPANKHLSNSCPKKSILKKVDQKTKIHIEKFKELNQVLDEKENNISCDYFEIDEFK